jgi:hypothetical protein
MPSMWEGYNRRMNQMAHHPTGKGTIPKVHGGIWALQMHEQPLYLALFGLMVLQVLFDMQWAVR